MNPAKLLVCLSKSATRSASSFFPTITNRLFFPGNKLYDFIPDKCKRTRVPKYQKSARAVPNKIKILEN